MAMSGYPAESLIGRIGRLSDPTNPDAVMQDGLPQVPLDEWDAEPVTAQTAAVGEPRRHAVGSVQIGESKKTLYELRAPLIVVGNDGKTNGILFIRPQELTPTKRAIVDSLPTIALNEAQELDQAEITGPTLTTVRKKPGGSTTAHFDTDEAVRARGGNPKYRIPKPAGSFGSPVIGRQIENAAPARNELR